MIKIDNVVDICIAINTSILGIAYPILIDKVSNIGEKYNSEYLSNLFNEEKPQKGFKIKYWRNKSINTPPIINLVIALSISMFIFKIFQVTTPKFLDFYLINNSADLLVVIFTTLLIITFIKWLKLISLYNGKTTKLLNHLINKHKLNPTDYTLKAINELTYHAIEKQDEHPQITLVAFYFEEFFKNYELTNNKNEIELPDDLYSFIFKLNKILIEKKNNNLSVIEHRAVSGYWYIGDGWFKIEISEKTYSNLWKNLYLICDYPKFIKQYWANVNQFYQVQLDDTYDDYDGIKSKEFKKKRKTSKRRFLEFHFALGGLLLYRNQFSSLKYLFEYSQSEPPKHYLILSNMTEIFDWFDYFRNDYKQKDNQIEYRYYFPEIDNIGSRKNIKFWICSYFCLLFTRQFHLAKVYKNERFIDLPNLPDDLFELDGLKDTISYFNFCVTALINKDSNIFVQLEFQNIPEKTEIDLFLSKYKEAIDNKITELKLNIELDEEKILPLNDNTNNLLSVAFEKIKKFSAPSQHKKIDEKTILTLRGESTLMSKQAFTKFSTHINYDTIFSEYIANYKIIKFFALSFFTTKTRRYTLNQETVLKGLEKLLSSNNRNVCIIGINIQYPLLKIIEGSIYSKYFKELPSFINDVRNVLFILNEEDLPYIENIKPSDNLIKEYNLQEINNEYQIYSRVIDINLPENIHIKDKWETERLDPENPQVQVTIEFLATLKWNLYRDIIQFNISTEYNDEGIQCDLNQIKKLDKYKSEEENIN